MKHLTYVDLFTVPTLQTDEPYLQTIYQSVVRTIRDKLKLCLSAARECASYETLSNTVSNFRGACDMLTTVAFNLNLPYITFQEQCRIIDMVYRFWNIKNERGMNDE